MKKADEEDTTHVSGKSCEVDSCKQAQQSSLSMKKGEEDTTHVSRKSCEVDSYNKQAPKYAFEGEMPRYCRDHAVPRIAETPAATTAKLTEPPGMAKFNNKEEDHLLERCERTYNPDLSNNALHVTSDLHPPICRKYFELLQDDEEEGLWFL